MRVTWFRALPAATLYISVHSLPYPSTSNSLPKNTQLLPKIHHHNSDPSPTPDNRSHLNTLHSTNILLHQHHADCLERGDRGEGA